MARTKKATEAPIDRLDAMLARLQLFGIRDQLDNLLDEAARANLSGRGTLILLCEREIARKDHRRIEMALELAHFAAVKELAGFDFEAQPSIDPKQIRDLAASRWIANGENVLLLGPPGVGKTHLSIALGREAILAGYPVQFTTATTLVAGLAKAHGERRLDEKLLALAKPKLLIVDELGYLPLEPDAAHLFFQLVSRRYETGAMSITSNRSVAEWGTVFADPVVATAILDRLLHHSHVLTIRGNSYRLRAKRKSASSSRPPLTARRSPARYALRSAPPPSVPSAAEPIFNRHHEPDGGGSSSRRKGAVPDGFDSVGDGTGQRKRRPDRGGELRGRGQYFRGRSAPRRCRWAADGVAAQVRDGSEPSGARLRAGSDRFRERSGDGRRAGPVSVRA